MLSYMSGFIWMIVVWLSVILVRVRFFCFVVGRFFEFVVRRLILVWFSRFRVFRLCFDVFFSGMVIFVLRFCRKGNNFDVIFFGNK